MNQLVKIGNQEITVKEYKGQRVITFKDIDLCHERPEGTAGRNFRENKKFFIDGEDYFYLEGDELKAYKQATNFVGSNARELILVTQQGYTMLTKSLTDDLAWAVQRELVNNYFSKPQGKPAASDIDLFELSLNAIKENQSRIESVNADLQEFKQEMPILGVEESRITYVVRKRGVECLGGKQSAAYQDKSIRSKIYADIYKQLKREFGVTSYKAIRRNQCNHAVKIIESYQPPYVLAEKVESINCQAEMGGAADD